MSDRSTAPRVSPWEWAQSGLLVVILGWTTYGLGGYRPETMVVTSGLTAVLLIVHLLARVTESEATRIAPHPAGWIILPFLVYAAANVLWVTPVRWLGWFDWLCWAHLVAVFWVVLNGVRSRAPRRLLFLSLVVLALSAVLLSGYQRFLAPDWLPLGRKQAPQFFGRASAPFGIPNSLAALLLLLTPATGALAFRRGAREVERVWWGWVTLVLLTGLALTVSRGAWIGLTLALIVWPLTAGRWRWKRRIGVAALVIVGVAIVSGGIYASSAVARGRAASLVQDLGERTRPLMWNAAWQLFREAPLTGTGAGSYNVLFERHRPERFLDQPVWVHNDYLNTLSDYGAVGFLLFFGAAGYVIVRCARGAKETHEQASRTWVDSRLLQGALAIGLLAFALQLVVDFNLKIPALAMACAATAGLVVARAWPVRVVRTGSFLSRGLSVVFAVTVAVIGWNAVLSYRAEAARRDGRELIDQLARDSEDRTRSAALLPIAREKLQRAVRLAPTHGEAWADLAYATALLSRVDRARSNELGEEAERAAERALSYSGENYEFWIRRGVARDMQGRWIEAGNDFAVAVKLAPTNALAWYYQAEHFSRHPTGVQLAHGSLTICLRLDPWSAPGLALRQRLAISAKPP